MPRTKYPIHPDFCKWEKVNPPLNRALLPVMQMLLGQLARREKSSETLAVRRESIPIGGGKALEALLYSPVGIGADAPCLVVYHGGGFVLPAAPHHFALAREYALRAPCHVLFADYRLAPRHPFPAAPQDSYAAYSWVLANARRLSIDAARVAVGGDSAGGQLATVVCLMARDRGQALPCAQMLLYPAAGRGLETESMKRYTDTPMCNSRDAAKYDRFYIHDPAADQPEYASPIHAASLRGLPPAYVETAEFDCLRDGAILYAERMREAGVRVELRNTAGTIHGFDIELNSPIVRACVDARVRFLQTAFEPGDEHPSAP